MLGRFWLRLLLCACLALPLQAREVDQYMAWGVELEDIGPAIDRYMRTQMAEGLAQVNDNKFRSLPAGGPGSGRKKVIPEKFFSCFNTAAQVMRAAFYSPTYQKIEKYADYHEGLDRYPRRPESRNGDERATLGQLPADGYMTDMEYLRASMIGSSPFYVPLSRIVNVHGVYMGADKLGHFTSFGARYMIKFRDLVLSGVDFNEAFMRVLELGYQSERSVVGMTFTGVFSRGDLEANFQGMRFAASLCRDESEIRLAFDGQNWQILNLERFSIEPYVNPGWDESYNTSIFSDRKWTRHVSPTFKAEDYCAKIDSTWFEEQRAHYNGFVDTSLNQQLEDRWLPVHFPGFDPMHHSLEYYCARPELYFQNPG